MALRVVLDTNCLVSALLFSKQKMSWLRVAWQSGLIIPIINKQTATELILVLNYPKFKLSQDEQQQLLAEILPYSETFTDDVSEHDLPKVRDSKDQVFLNIAVASKVDVLVTGDNDLLSIRDLVKQVRVMTLNEFKQELKIEP